MQLVYPPVYRMRVTRSCCNSTNDHNYGNDEAEWVRRVLERAHADYVGDDEESDIMSIHSDNASQSDAGSAQVEEDQSESRKSSDQAGGDDEVEEPTASRDPSPETDVDDFTISEGVDSTMRIQCSTGLTIKHLLEATQHIREKHRNSPFARRRLHNKDGTVAMEVCFHGMVRLENDDPYLVERDRKETRLKMARMSDEGQLTHESLLSSFVKSKRRGE